MKNLIKATKKINCSTCRCEMKRTKSIKVIAMTTEGAKKEAEEKINEWVKTLTNQDCKICKTIKADLAS